MKSRHQTNDSPGPDGWTLPALLAAARLEGDAASSFLELPVTGVTDDSRSVERGTCFVAVKGLVHDGHDHLSGAVAAGACAVVVDRDYRLAGDLGGVVVVRAEDTRVAIARLASAFYGVGPCAIKDFPLVGVTGTNGKTTVTWMVRAILKAASLPAAMIGTVAYDLVSERVPAPLTTPGAVQLCQYLAQSRNAGARCGVIEVSSHALEQRRCDGLSFAVGVFTNLSGDHLDYHGDMAAYFSAKRRLFELVAEDGRAIINLDDPSGERLAGEVSCDVVTYGVDRADADATATIETMTRLGSDITLALNGATVPLRLPVIGRHNVSNALAAAAAARALGVATDAIVAGLEGLSHVPGRMQRVEPPGEAFSAYVDYAHTDAALENALATLRPLTEGRLICVFGCGGDRDRTKRPRMAAAASRSDVAFVTSDNPRSEAPETIINDILPGFGAAPACRVFVDADRRRAITAAIGMASAGDCVLIAGKGHEDYQLIGDAVLPFDDAEVAAACFTDAVTSSARAEGVA